jgi:hypothetical protein
VSEIAISDQMPIVERNFSKFLSTGSLSLANIEKRYKNY